MKIARGHVVALHGVNQGRQDLFSAGQSRRGRDYRSVAVKNLLLTGNGLIERPAPTRETALFGAEVLAFVRNVVDQAHESVEGRESIALRFRQKKKRVVEVAVRGAGYVVAVFVGFGNGCRRLRRSVAHRCACRH